MFSGGSVPFAGRTPQSQGTTTRAKIAWEHLYLALPPLSLYNSYPPPGLDELIQTAMHKNPKKRFQTAIEFYSAFERICQNEAGETRRWPSSTSSPAPPVPPSPSPTPPPQTSERPKYPVPAPTLRGPVLFVRSGDYTGQVIPIPKDNAGLTIGRSSQMRLCLGERSISRTHATILLGAKGVYLRDENSTGGTLVNGARISGVVLLHPGDIIQIGSQQVFEFQNR
jgi:serine/threonine protein kinase